MKLKVNRKPTGLLVEKVTVKDRKGFTKHHEEKEHQIPSREPSDGEVVAMVRDVVSVRLSLNFNSAMVECGIDMPMPVKPGDVEGARKAMVIVEKLVTQRMEKKSVQLGRILRDLGGK